MSSEQDAVIYLVAGDVHGNLDGLYATAWGVQKRHKVKIHGILQAGDFGAFSRESPLDRATLRHAERDPSELGIFEYLEGSKVASFPTYFCRGNHDDRDFLQGKSAIDPQGMLIYLPDGSISVLPGGLRVASLGGVDSETRPAKKDPQRTAKKDPQRAKGHLCWQAVTRLLDATGPVDVLLVHDGPVGCCLERDSMAGSPWISEVVSHLSPRFVFFGHYDHAASPRKVGTTWIVPLNQHDVFHIPKRDGGVGLLDTSTQTFSFLTVDRNLGLSLTA
jgi:hypothetical protein